MSKIAVASFGITLIAGGASGAILNHFWEKEEFEVSANSCSAKGPEKAFIENVKSGHRVQVPLSEMPAVLDRVTNIINTGKKPIDGEDIYIAVDNEIGAKLLQSTIFFESPLSKHELIADESGTTFKIKLKNFNPRDMISVLIASDRQIGITVLSKGSGFTLQSRFQRQQTCSLFSSISSYGGVVAYSKVAEDCSMDPETLSLRCSGGAHFQIPPDFPPGPARLIFR
jgi:hypothetical protein